MSNCPVKLTPEQRSEALHWYAVCNYDLQTIGQHYGLTSAEIAKELNTEKERDDE